MKNVLVKAVTALFEDSYFNRHHPLLDRPLPLGLSQRPLGTRYLRQGVELPQGLGN